MTREAKTVMDKLRELFLEFHEEECPNSSRGIDFNGWAERAFEAVMGTEEPTCPRQDSNPHIPGV